MGMNIYYPFYRFIETIKNIPRSLKFIYQKLRFGFTDKETWNLDYCIAKYTLPRLKRFKKVCNGVPCLEEFDNLTIDEKVKEWNKMLDKIIYAMESVKSNYTGLDDDIDWSLVDEGLVLFGKHFRSLWW